MTTTTTTPARTAAEHGRALAAVLFSRRGTVYTPAADGGERPEDPPAVISPDTGAGPVPVDTLAGLALLESDLLERGLLLSPGLRDALAALGTTALAAAGRDLLADTDTALGADRDHIPLFRGFPGSTPANTRAFFADRVLTVLLQHPEQPCVLCSAAGSVRAVSPCAHLVCRACFDGADFSACPVCHRRIGDDGFLDPAHQQADGDGPRSLWRRGTAFLRPARPRPTIDPKRALPSRLRVLGHGGDLTARTADAWAELDSLLARGGQLSPRETGDLLVLLESRERTDLSWLPAEVPGRTTRALLSAWLLGDRAAHPVTLPAVAAMTGTATDVLRLIMALSGGDPGLVGGGRIGALPRPVRRALLSVLDGLDPAAAAEDMGRHRQAWKHAAERLHPFEQAARHPRAALAVAALRGLRLGGDRLSELLRETAAGVPGADLSGGTVVLRSGPALIERALASGDTGTALALLAGRPGELLRRLDHLLRLTAGQGEAARSSPDDTDRILAAMEHALPRVSPAVLLSALGALRTRARSGERPERVFFPKGGAAKAHIVPDDRVVLPAPVVERAVTALTGEILRRAGALPPVEVAVVDTGLDGLIAPFAERTAARALVSLPRGSELPVPDGRTVRFFLHWMESADSGRVDLDLSLSLYDEEWVPAGRCDYTRLRFKEDAAVHSGDLTSAPAPRGASEFIDLDLDRLAAENIRYAVAVVFSYNNVAFEDMAEGFAGLMVRDRPGGDGPVFDPRQVEQRFDLTSRARASVPLVIDVAERSMRWLDVVKGVTGTDHSVARHRDGLGVLAGGLHELFAGGSRVGLGELARLQAAARARTVVLRRPDGTRSAYRRRDGETVAAFAARVGTPGTDDAGPAAEEEAGLAFLVRGDVPLPAGAEVYALYPAGLDAGAVRLLTAPDLVTSLAAG
ncbi:MXAN_6230/SCO0854 family RING domain-containing protein [Streptomyces sp. CAU 1734]|uniref:MXAN_6230/SCO0854 family RING domain-containing protein n=1 Tax=Streptomyces sp. CAU 1734 TaxID=3140360 RepID=UPI00325FFDF1